MTTWWISTRHMRNPLQNRLAHVLGEHMGYGSYRTVCSAKIRILVDHRERVDISTVPEKAVCPRCRKLTQRPADEPKPFRMVSIEDEDGDVVGIEAEW